MAPSPADYELVETLYQSERTTVSRARRGTDGETVILKCLTAPDPGPQDLLRFRRELEIAEALQGDRFVALRGGMKEKDLRCVILEDFGGESLDRTLMQRRFDVGEFLKIAIELVTAVGRLHEQGIIHRDINPSNIVWNPSTGEVKLIDFGISIRRHGERAVDVPRETTAGTVAYMSPEQTGRTRRVVDYRSDYYGLGVTLYELLTGRHPFEVEDDSKMVHAHLARTPIPPDQRRGDVPFQLSAIIMRLLAKSVDDRYQSARGLQADLKRCLAQWQADGRIEEFALGQEDVRQTLQLSQRLYGRRRELKRLVQRVEEAGEGRRGLMLVRGEAGIGKSALLVEMGMLAAEKKAWSVKGKFDPTGGAKPYSACSEALGQLVELLLGCSESVLEMWRRRVESALEDDVGLLVALVPGLERILHVRSESPGESELREKRHRLQRAIRRFIGLFCERHRPLVIALDDMHWADEESLKLIEWLVTDEAMEHLLMVGSFRPEEVDEDHRLMGMVDRLRHGGQSLETIDLRPLKEEEVCLFVADSLGMKKSAVRSLAGSLYEKTEGNPLFVHQVLKQWYRDGNLWFNADAGLWRWDENQVSALPVALNVVDHLAGRIANLEEETRRLLMVAALLGTRFSLDHLVVASGLEPGEVYGHLKPALNEGILVAFAPPRLWNPVDPDSPLVACALGFSHDRVREAAQKLWSGEELVAAHLNLGRLLEAHYREEPETELLFTVVEHLNSARELLVSRQERRKLVQLNLKAGQVALEAAASHRAVELLTIAQQLLGDDPEAVQTQLGRQVSLALCRAKLLAGQLEEAQQGLEEALRSIRDPVWRAEFVLLLIEKHSLELNADRAMEVGVASLQELGVELAMEGDLDQALMVEFAEIEEKLDGRPVYEALTIIGAEDERIDAALRVLSALQAAAAQVDQRLFNLVGLKVTALSLEIGVRPATPKGLVVYGGALCLLGDPRRGYEAGDLALRLARQFANKADLAHVEVVFAAMISPWTRHLRESLPLFEEGKKAGLRSGNYLPTGFHASAQAMFLFYLGRPLEQVDQCVRQGLELSEEIQHTVARGVLTGVGLVVRGLMERRESVRCLDDEELGPQSAFVAQCEISENRAAFVTFIVGYAQLLYLYGHSTEALRQLEAVEGELGAAIGTFSFGRHPFFYALALLDSWFSEGEEVSVEGEKTLKRVRRRLKELAENCPQNFEHKKLLVDAEVARLKGDVEGAVELYDRAIEEAREQDFLHMEALANERAARFWLDRGKEGFASQYLRAARFGYQLWQAQGKVEQLEEEFDWLGEGGEGLEVSKGSTGGEAMDVASLLKATETIASALDLEELLPTLTEVILENAGAQKGAFLVANDGRLAVAVEGEVSAEPTVYDPPLELEDWQGGPHQVVRYVLRTTEPLVLGRAYRDRRFRQDPYLREHRVRSVLCIPTMEHGRLRGVLYVENNLDDDVFTEERIQVLRLLSGHIAIALNKVRLYARLHDREQRFRQLAENIQEVFWLMEWPSGCITYVSPAYEVVWGRPVPEQELGVEEWVEVVDERHRSRVTSALREDAPRGQYDQTYQIRRPSGSTRWIRDRGFAIRDRRGETYRVVGVAVDITREQEVARMRDEFVSVVSHELRTPLTPITGIFSMLSQEDEPEVSDRVREMAQLGLRNSRRLLRLIDDLLDIQRLSMDEVEFELKPLDVREVVSEAVEFNEPLGTMRGLRYEVCLRDEPVVVEVDRGRLLQVLTNLLSNAAKFSGRGDTIRVSVEETDDGERIARISIADQGPGIPEHMRDRVFEKFIQADSSLTREHGGTGLGLAIARSIVERLGGRIWFESEAGRGTTFFVDLPLAVR